MYRFISSYLNITHVDGVVSRPKRNGSLGATAVDLIGFVIGRNNSAQGSRDKNIIVLLLYYSTAVIGLKRIENDTVSAWKNIVEGNKFILNFLREQVKLPFTDLSAVLVCVSETYNII